MTKTLSISGLILALMAGAANAHPGIGHAAGFMHGFAHPIGGVDHVLAMIAVGLFAAMLGGRALWFVPATFVAMMAAGGILGFSGAELPLVETGIGLSVVVLGLAVALRRNVQVMSASALVGFFAVFHGFAHGAEMPAGTSAVTYALGFMLATALLHGVGIAFGLGFGRFANVARIGGGAIAVAGAGLLSGLV